MDGLDMGEASVPLLLIDLQAYSKVGVRSTATGPGGTTVETIEMACQIDNETLLHLADLVYPVGEHEAAILDMHRGIGMADVTAVDIGKAGHGNPRNTGC